jgi:hypothetical protein
VSACGGLGSSTAASAVSSCSQEPLGCWFIMQFRCGSAASSHHHRLFCATSCQPHDPRHRSDILPLHLLPCCGYSPHVWPSDRLRPGIHYGSSSLLPLWPRAFVWTAVTATVIEADLHRISQSSTPSRGSRMASASPQKPCQGISRAWDCTSTRARVTRTTGYEGFRI